MTKKNLRESIKKVITHGDIAINWDITDMQDVDKSIDEILGLTDQYYREAGWKSPEENKPTWKENKWRESYYDK